MDKTCDKYSQSERALAHKNKVQKMLAPFQEAMRPPMRFSFLEGLRIVPSRPFVSLSPDHKIIVASLPLPGAMRALKAFFEIRFIRATFRKVVVTCAPYCVGAFSLYRAEPRSFQGVEEFALDPNGSANAQQADHGLLGFSMRISLALIGSNCTQHFTVPLQCSNNRQPRRDFAALIADSWAIPPGITLEQETPS